MLLNRDVICHFNDPNTFSGIVAMKKLILFILALLTVKAYCRTYDELDDLEKQEYRAFLVANKLLFKEISVDEYLQFLSIELDIERNEFYKLEEINKRNIQFANEDGQTFLHLLFLEVDDSLVNLVGTYSNKDSKTSSKLLTANK